MTLTLKYSDDQQYQLDAIAATIDLFRDQRFSTSSFHCGGGNIFGGV